MDDYELGETIGFGSFSTVHRATNKRTGSVVAIKLAAIEKDKISNSEFELPGDRILAYDMKRINREIELWKPLDHDNLCRLLDVIVDENCNEVAFIMEYARDGDLLTLLSGNKMIPFQTVKDYFIQLCESVKYLHSQGLIHGDIKLENILLSGSKVKLSDFGLARCVDEDFFDNCGTVEYAAPELLSQDSFERSTCPFKADMWALGVVLYALIFRQFPYDAPTSKILKVRILTSEPIYGAIEESSSILVSIVKSLLQKKPELRPSIEDLLYTLHSL